MAYGKIYEYTLSNEERTLLKREALQTQDTRKYNAIFYEIYKAYRDGKDTLAQELSYFIRQEARLTHYNYLQVIDNLLRSRQRKAKTLKEKIQFQLEQSATAYFVTFTFDDNTLASTNEQTRRKYITRLLKSLATYYVANIDFGKTTAREHYHAVINAPVEPEMWPYGFIWCKRIGKTESTAVSIGKYITKLTNHALKDTTNGNARFRTVIYSRNK